jgi:hypothetical protein
MLAKRSITFCKFFSYTEGNCYCSNGLYTGLLSVLYTLNCPIVLFCCPQYEPLFKGV